MNTDNRLDRCGGCGCRLPGEHIQRRWEDGVLPYIIVPVLIALIVTAVWYLFRWRDG
jgi:hypothetical protein